ncbi:60S ribosomal protein L24 [Vanrija albida]|uniref:60S ribosomal protein L24 n=1 Tax=Vanrija albida TaxID=181172 RepID=A0ABR3PVF3_9TREE
MAGRHTKMRIERCDFSGAKVYPSRGKTYVRGDSKTFRFIGSKAESLFLQRKNPRKIAWTQVYRRMHKKGITEEVAKKRSRKNVKVQRGVVGADLASILAKRTAKPEVRAAARAAAITKAKAQKKEKESTKAARPQGVGAPKVAKNPKGSQPKGSINVRR